MYRILQSGCALGAALLVLAGAASAEAVSSEDVRDLDGGALYHRYITNGLTARMLAFEWTDRTALLNSCTARGNREKFPMYPSPRKMAVANVVQKWMIDGPLASKKKIANYQGMRLLQEAAFTPGELAEWDRFRKTAQGKRALNIAALFRAVEVTAGSLIDNRNGRDWNWPLANLGEMADAAQLRPALDKALDKVSPASAEVLTKVSATPGEIRNDAAGRELRETFLKHSENLQEAMLAQLDPDDRQALDALVQQPVYLRWLEIVSAWREFRAPETKPDYKASAEPAKLEAVTAFCDKLKLQSCKPDSPLAQGLEKARHDYRSIQDSDLLYPDPQIVAAVKHMPEAGCPQTALPWVSLHSTHATR